MLRKTTDECGVAAAIVLCLALAGCATRANPDIEALRVSYLRASSDPELRRYAAEDLGGAEATLRRAEEVWEKSGDEREVEHLVYLGRRRIELAETKAAYAETRAEIANLDAGTAAVAEEGGLRPSYEIDSAVGVTQRSTPDGTVFGEVTNRSPTTIRDVELMIRYEWFWADEMNPGDYSPGRTDRYTVREQIPPGETVSFTYRPAAALPRRGDGHFEVKIRSVGLVEVPR